MPALLDTRDENSEVMSGSSSLRPVYIAGFCVVGAILIGLAIWLSIRIYRRRAQAKRDNVRGAAFLSVKGLVREDANEKEPLPENLQALQGGTFSRQQLTRSVVLPEKPDQVLNRNNPQDVLEYHRQSGMFPRAFAPSPGGSSISSTSTSATPKPFSFALGAGNRGSVIKADRSSFLSVGSRYSIMSTLSAASSTDSSSPTTRKVRQVFNPILPDELTVTAGERLTLVQSFDDGWCVVGRENKSAYSNTRSLFKAATPQQQTQDDSIELGVIPAWCFIKPVKGLKAERPVRSSSLGITVQMDGPGFSSREELISWSNF